MTNFQSKHVALHKNKKDCADVYCVTLIELQAHRDAFIQNTNQFIEHNGDDEPYDYKCGNTEEKGEVSVVEQSVVKLRL